MKSIIGREQFLKLVPDGATIMVGGFLAVGTPEKLIDLVLTTDKKNFTIICNDTAFPDRGVGKWIVAKKVKKVLTSHIGTNPETGRQFNAKEIVVELNPQGTLAERIRAYGAGLGGVLTPTGRGTAVEEG
ncbi:MAG: branched-chain amino acid dehydrogenase, partial [Candidatus Wallbacteria bacterium]|nr:branched-chain amino acid dehydrogenase [Candidatus Wallbacteria bacterium]